ncbi:hypothetical protein [Streptomyces erythrochromogenes]|uniref:hypothetical protein n=1 Tax=Streptomyces erythrochromogenes TaxID=285574 RepID=UPI0004CD35DE|nr:hypothetical protein [Streptomyces erythrochromogenes]
MGASFTPATGRCKPVSAPVTTRGRPEHVIGILTDAYGLTLREQQVAQLVTFGVSDTDSDRTMGRHGWFRTAQV